MGWLSNLIGSPDDSLLTTGELARGHILGLSAGTLTMSVMNALPERKCTFTVQVYREGHEPYTATVAQRVQEVYIPQLASGSAWVAVRVDPANPARIALDFATAPPEVQVKAVEGESSAASILETGRPVEVVLVQAQPLGMTAPNGDAVYLLTLTVIDGAEAPYQTQVGNAVPTTSLPILYPGSRLHARRGDGAGDIVVDWSLGAVPPPTA
ncbi:hypothetical protein [Microcella sp.]|uniref:hypothetical protein n=1 Tax=Microcella sp. TaxID=1913979 RepID=UPI003F6F61A9